MEIKWNWRRRDGIHQRTAGTGERRDCLLYTSFGGIVKEEKADFTSRELAAICGVSVRTMDRIILKLCDAGYCEVISEKLMHKSGRPSRILRLHPLQIYNG